MKKKSYLRKQNEETMINRELLDPQSIVIVGGSNNQHKPGGAIVRNLLQGGFKGTLSRRQGDSPHGTGCARDSRQAVS